MITELINHIQYFYFYHQGKKHMNNYMRVVNALNVGFVEAEKECKVLVEYKNMAKNFAYRARAKRLEIRRGGLFD